HSRHARRLGPPDRRPERHAARRAHRAAGAKPGAAGAHQLADTRHPAALGGAAGARRGCCVSATARPPEGGAPSLGEVVAQRPEDRRVTEPASAPALRNAFTVDVEDYFQVSAFAPYIARSEWAQRECRVEANVERILAML